MSIAIHGGAFRSDAKYGCTVLGFFYYLEEQDGFFWFHVIG